MTWLAAGAAKPIQRSPQQIIVDQAAIERN
jgi:hypothetical protein